MGLRLLPKVACNSPKLLLPDLARMLINIEGLRKHVFMLGPAHDSAWPATGSRHAPRQTASCAEKHESHLSLCSMTACLSGKLIRLPSKGATVSSSAGRLGCLRACISRCPSTPVTQQEAAVSMCRILWSCNACFGVTALQRSSGEVEQHACYASPRTLLHEVCGDACSK